jgi:hypothetical protein
MAGHVKIYGNKLLKSSVWVGTDKATKICWVALLAMADKHGIVLSSLPGLAKEAEVTVQEAGAAIKMFLSPDPYSSTPDLDGRRIIEVDGGWQLVNHQKYRDFRTEKQVKDAERKRRQRERDAGHVTQDSGDVTQNHVTSTPKGCDTGYGYGDGDGSGSRDGSPEEIPEEGEESSGGTALTFPTASKPVRADEISAGAIVEFVSDSHKADELRNAYATALFSYYCAKTKKRKGQTFLSVDRLNRLKHHIRQRGLSFCLYVVDGGVKHPHLNQTDKGKPKTWELASFFPYDNADRLEKLVSITEIGERPTHPLIDKYPELGGGDA